MLPEELKKQRQWVCWKKEQRKDQSGNIKNTKVPYHPRGFRASTVNAVTWTDYDTAKQAVQQGRFDGIGFVFTKEDPYVGIDLDHVLDENLQFKYKDAEKLFQEAQSYTELSPSGTGIHILGKAVLHDASHRTEADEEKGLCEKELYDQGRFFTVTENQLGKNNQLNNLQSLCNELENQIGKEQASKKERAKPQERATAISNPSLFQLTQSLSSVIQSGPAANLEKKAGQIEEFLKTAEILRIKKGREGFHIEYQQNDRIHTVNVYRGEDEGIPTSAPERKSYFYRKLIQTVDERNAWDIQKLPKQENLGTASLYLIEKIKKEPMNQSFCQISLGDIGKEMKQTPKDVWMNIKEDMGKFPELAPMIHIYEIPGKEKGILVSREMPLLFTQSYERSQKQELTVQRPSIVSEKQFRPLVRDVYFMSEENSSMQWLKERGITCGIASSEMLSNKNFRDCHFEEISLHESKLENAQYDHCSFENIQLKNTEMKNVILEQCRFSSSKDLLAIEQAGGEIRDGLVFEYDPSVQKNRWNLVSKNRQKSERNLAGQNAKKLEMER